MSTVATAKSAFEDLPDSIRDQFTAEEFVEFCTDESSRHELADMGLLSEEATLAYLDEQKAATAASDASHASTNEPEAPPQLED